MYPGLFYKHLWDYLHWVGQSSFFIEVYPPSLCHMSHVPCHKVVELAGRGCIINRVYPVLFLPRPRSVGSAMTIRHPFGTWDIKQWHKVKTSYRMANIPWTPNIFTYSELHNKWLIGGQIKHAQTPQTPLMGGQSIFLGGMTDWPFWSPWNKICMESYHLLILYYLFLRSDLTPRPELLKIVKNGTKWLQISQTRSKLLQISQTCSN